MRMSDLLWMFKHIKIGFFLLKNRMSSHKEQENGILVCMLYYDQFTRNMMYNEPSAGQKNT